MNKCIYNYSYMDILILNRAYFVYFSEGVGYWFVYKVLAKIETTMCVYQHVYIGINNISTFDSK